MPAEPVQFGHVLKTGQNHTLRILKSLMQLLRRAPIEQKNREKDNAVSYHNTMEPPQMGVGHLSTTATTL